MGLYCEFDIINDYGFIESTPVFDIYPDYSAGCQAFVDTFLQVANELVPVDTGYLRSTLTAGYDDTLCYAETICEYAQYPEYGTWCQLAQPYFEPAIQMALGAAIPLWEIAQMDAYREEEELMKEIINMDREQEDAAMGKLGLSGMLFIILLTIISALVKVFFEDLFGDKSSGNGGGSVFMPEIYII